MISQAMANPPQSRYAPAVLLLSLAFFGLLLEAGCAGSVPAPQSTEAPAARATAPQSPVNDAPLALPEPEQQYLSDAYPSTPPSPHAAMHRPPPGVPGIALPDQNELIVAPDPVPTVSLNRSGSGAVKLPFSLVDEASILADDASQHRPGRPTGPKATMQLFQSPPVSGHSFVFVIDRSASMGAGGLGAIGAAAMELAAQLTSLTADQKVQVVAYNQSSVYFTGRELISATDENKAKLVKYIAELGDFGQTEHERGLLAALRLKPDVIYLLTDGGDPHLRPGQVSFLVEQAAGETQIHCLHFGTGTADAIPADHFLRRLAAETEGSYAFISVGGKP